MQAVYIYFILSYLFIYWEEQRNCIELITLPKRIDQ